MTSDQTAALKPASRSRLLPAALTATAAAAAANGIARLLLGALVEIPASFPPLQLPAILIFTVLGTAAAGLVYGLVRRISRRPRQTFLTAAVIALILSILPNLGLMANPAMAPFPGGSAQLFGLLILFHVIAAFISVAVLLNHPQTKERV